MNFCLMRARANAFNAFTISLLKEERISFINLKQMKKIKVLYMPYVFYEVHNVEQGSQH